MNLSPDWLVGFTDGEAAFQVIIHSQPSTISGFNVECRFTIGLSNEEKPLLEAIMAFFNVGQVINRDLTYVRKQGIGSKDQSHYVVRGDDCQTIDKFFATHQLNSNKRLNYEIWSKILTMVKNKRHRHVAGILEIAKLRDQMKVKTRDYRYRNYHWFLEHWGLDPLFSVMPH